MKVVEFYHRVIRNADTRVRVTPRHLRDQDDQDDGSGDGSGEGSGLPGAEVAGDDYVLTETLE